nr:reverse transcriptase domain-containing protein [Tanacetum cinerariifolium]
MAMEAKVLEVVLRDLYALPMSAPTMTSSNINPLTSRKVGHDAAYGMPWKTLIKMMTVKYCPRSEIKKLEIKIWNLKVKGTDAVGYTQRFQELALMCGRMFSEESDEVEKYVDGLSNMIQVQVSPQWPVHFKVRELQESETFNKGLLESYLLLAIKRTITCYECGNQGYYKSDCLKLKNQNHGKQAEGTEAREMSLRVKRIASRNSIRVAFWNSVDEEVYILVLILLIRERVFVDGLEEGLSETLAGEEIPINDVPELNAASSKSIVAHLVSRPHYTTMDQKNILVLAVITIIVAAVEGQARANAQTKSLLQIVTAPITSPSNVTVAKTPTLAPTTSLATSLTMAPVHTPTLPVLP